MNSFSSIIDEMKSHGMITPIQRVMVAVPDASNVLHNAMEYFIGLEGKKLIWLPEYDEVIKWLENSEGKGLFLFGSCGQGKTVLTRYAIPAILLKYNRIVCNCFDMNAANKNPELVLSKRIISLDDIGTEDVSNQYGNKRLVFAEVVDQAEKDGKLLILTSNLGKDQIVEKYGDRVYDRVIATTKRIVFNGKSLRK